jgi:K+-sensing histidine kinase KdpD
MLFGNEAWGLPPEIARLADVSVRVPLLGRAESLNLAAAATVCLFEAARQRREGRRVGLEAVIASAAHDIRSPLTAMKGFGYALATRWDQMAGHERTLMLEGIMYDTDRLNTIVRQLVDAARLAAGRLELMPERVDVGEMVAKVAASLGRDPEHPPIEWHGDVTTAFVDPDRLRLVIEAFVEAEKWWASQGPIRVRGSASRGRLRVEVARAGTGLGPEAAEALFDARAPGAGSGSKIGLFVARGVAEAQGGVADVEVTDELRFILDVPIAGEDQASD